MSLQHLASGELIEQQISRRAFRTALRLAVWRLRLAIGGSLTAAVLTSIAAVVLASATATLLLAKALADLAKLPAVEDAVIARSGDAVYGRLTLALVGNMQARGLGDWLTVVFTSASSVVGVQLARLVVDLGLLFAAALLLTLRLRRPRRSGVDWPLTGLAIAAAYAIGASMRLAWGSGSGGEMVLSMIATKLFGVDGDAYDAAASVPGFSLLVDVAIVALVAAAAVGLALLPALMRRTLRFRPLPRLAQLVRPRTGPRMMLLLATLLTLVGASQKPAVAFERSASAAVRFDAKPGHGGTAMPDLPSVVTVERSGDSWRYLVNGKPEIVHGIGYNAVTTDESRDARAARYDRDFAAMSDAGVNTIAGWTENEFDDLLMRKAAEHGLGVILPFRLGPTYVLSEPDYAYEDPQVRQQLLDAVTRRVEHYRNSPALRMWGLGNEVLHAIAWAHGSAAHSQAFATFLVEAADRVHQLDPNHPVIYRDAEDWYVQPIINALAANPKPRPWFIYGMNFFTTRMETALDSGPVTKLDQPLLISEFGPVGLRPEERPDGYRQLWDIIRNHPKRVLGGSAYVWTTAGPEPLDRSFGLTDDDGEPVDGSLAQLAQLYQQDQ